jgi:hypothetical protein
MASRAVTTNGLEPPARRPLKIFAFDPMLARLDSTRVISIKVTNEPLRPGPQGSRIEVIDYDGVNKCLYDDDAQLAKIEALGGALSK